jgi:hypothetical protein
LTDDYRARGYVARNGGVCADCRVVTNSDVADQGCAGTDGYTVSNCRVALHRFESFSAKSYPVIDVNIVADYCGFSDYDTHAVVDEQSTTDCGTRMYLNTSPKAGEV